MVHLFQTCNLMKIVRERILRLLTDKPEEILLASNLSVNSICEDLWVMFNCSSSGSNPAVFSYSLYDNKELIGVDENGVWITNVNEMGNRSYHCEANHLLGTGKSADNINLTVNGKPELYSNILQSSNILE